MEIETINKIRNERDAIRKQIKNINFKEFNSQTYGDEDEYTIKDLISTIESLLTDISTLTKYPSRFVKISTYNERDDIYKYLHRIF